MRTRSRRLVAILLLGVLPGASALAHGSAPATRTADDACALVLAVLVEPSATLEPDRAAIARQLVDLGHDPAGAREAAELLTAEDLAVLLDNPAMMQRAGTLSTLQLSLIIGTVIVAGLVVLAVASDGGFVVRN